MKRLSLLLSALTTFLLVSVCAGYAGEPGLFYFNAEGNYNLGNYKLNFSKTTTAKATEKNAVASKTFEYSFENANGIGGGGGMGCNMDEDIRAELMLNYARLSRSVKNSYAPTPTDPSKVNDQLHSIKLVSYAALVNGYFDIINSSSITPYLMAGVGVGKVKVEYTPSKEGLFNADKEAILDADKKSLTSLMSSTSSTKILYQIGGGIGVELLKGIYIDVGYRLSNNGSPTFSSVSVAPDTATAGTTSTLSITSKNTIKHTLHAGIRFSF
ncbi:exported hypothetical protein [Alphaproteobacteria bacterium]